jgi:ribosomal protein L11 methylase PrmA
LNKGGTLVLAGILAAEFGEVEHAFAELKLRLRSSRVEKEWRSGAFCFE